MNKFFLIADINKSIVTVNLGQVVSIDNPQKHEDTDIITNTLTMSNGDSWEIPVQLLIAMLNTSGAEIYDLISPPKDMTEPDDVNDTEYVDETPLEEPRMGEVELQEYPAELNQPDGHEEFTTEMTAGEELDYDPSEHVNAATVMEGSEGIADVTITATGTGG